jgi:transmembrane sensor
MSAKQNINPNQQLTRALDEYVASGFAPAYQPDDPLGAYLVAYREHSLDQISFPDSTQLWNKIQTGIEPAVVPHIWYRAPAFRYAVAAILLMTAVTLVYLFRSSPSAPALIAESQEVIQTYTTTDGSEITLRPHTKLFLLSSTKNRQVYRLDGEAYFNVNHNPDRVFEVEAGTGLIQDLGTRFDVSNWGNLVQVYLEQGSVAFSNAKTGGKVILKPGQYSSIVNQSQPSKPVAESREDATDWMQNQMIFNSRSLHYVFNELEQQYQITLQVPSGADSLYKEKLSGRIQLDSVWQSLDDLGLVLGGRFKKNGDRTYQFIPKRP